MLRRIRLIPRIRTKWEQALKKFKGEEEDGDMVGEKNVEGLKKVDDMAS